MSRDNISKGSVFGLNTVNIVVGAGGVGLLLAAAAVSYVRAKQHPSKSKLAEAFESARSVGTPSLPFGRKKIGLAAAIKVLENDFSRKALIVALKAIAKKSR